MSAIPGFSGNITSLTDGLNTLVNNINSAPGGANGAPLPAAQGGTGSATGAASFPPNVTNFVPSATLANWRLALANVRSGVSDARILFCGDSTTAGIGSSNANVPSSNAYPARLAKLLNSTATPWAHALGCPASNLTGSTDTRWTLGTGWSTWTLAGFGNGSGYKTSAATGNLVFAPQNVNCDGFYVYYAGDARGTFTATATGGSPVTLGSGTGMVKSVYVPAASAGTSNTLTITQLTGSVYIAAVEPALSTTKQVLVGNGGVGSSTTVGWTTVGSYGSVQLIQAIAPQLTVFSLGVNDANNATAPSVVQANLQTLITAAKASGDVLLCDYPPSNAPANRLTYEPLYIPVYQALAAANNCSYASFWGRFGGVTNMAYSADGTHPNDQGYFDWAAFLANVIGNP